MVQGLNPGVGKGFALLHTCSDQPWVPLSLLYNGYSGFPEDKVTRVWCCHAPLLEPTICACCGMLWSDFYLYQDTEYLICHPVKEFCN